MTYCDGSLGADGRGRNITGCSSRTIPFSFNPTEALLRDVPYDTSLAALGWPDAITGDFRAFALTTHTMSVLYCMGAAMAGAGIMARLGLEIAEKPRRRLAEGSLFLVRCSPIAVALLLPDADTSYGQASFTSLGIASIIASVMSFEFVALINYHGKGSGVTAQYGGKFLGMSWTAVVLLLAGSVLSLVFPVGSQEGTGTGAAKVVEEP
jgi:hypothetical protein